MTTRKNQRGFTLVELIIVVAIMAILAWMIVPAWSRYVTSNKKVACRHNREALLKIYERCLYDSSVPIYANTSDIESIVKGSFRVTSKEVDQYKNCPYGNVTGATDFDASVVTNTADGTVNGSVNTVSAVIHCGHCNDDVVASLETGWRGDVHVAEVDRPISPMVNPPRVPGDDENPGISPGVIPPAKEKYSWPATSGSGSADWWLDLSKMSPEDAEVYRKQWEEAGFTDYVTSGSKDKWYYDMQKPSGIIKAEGTNDRFVYIDNPNKKDAKGRDQKIWYEEDDGTTLGDIYSYSAMHPYWMVKLTGQVHEYDADAFFEQYGGRYFPNEDYDENDPDSGSEFYEIPVPIAAHSNGDLVKIKVSGKEYTYVYYTEEFDLWGLFLSCERVENYENDPTSYEEDIGGGQCLFRVDF